jgi:DNA invertase Pin-like site-specific DNA recombinase
MSNKQLRFASLIRVSTEKQEKQGESLTTQRKSNERDVERLGGKIVATYGGQEHATAGWERKEVDRLLADASRNVFDAVIVTYADRWSRDNKKSKEGLEILRDNDIKFFLGASEMNLFSPEVKFLLGMHAEVGEFVAGQTAKKTLETKIERALQGKPACGDLPFGRTFQDGKWGVDPQAQAMIQDVAARLLAGEPLGKLAQEYKVAVSNLWKVLRHRCGDQWEQRFRSKKLNIDETVITTVPPLLDERTIRAVGEYLDARRTFLHQPPKRLHDYLLSGRVFCAECGYLLTGQHDVRCNLTYYIHGGGKRYKKSLCPCSLRPKPRVRADWLEGQVVSQLFGMFGNPLKIETAIRSAVPDCDGLTKRKAKLDADLARLVKSRDSILGLIIKGTITDEQAEKRLGGLKENERSLREELRRLADQLGNLPDEDTLRRYVERIKTESGFTITVRDEGGKLHSASGKCFDNYFVRDEDGKVHAAKPEDVDSFLNTMMSKDDRRHLIDAVFAKPLSDGKPAGVYITPAGKKGRSWQWKFTIRGLLEFAAVVPNHVEVPFSRCPPSVSTNT